MLRDLKLESSKLKSVSAVRERIKTIPPIFKLNFVHFERKALTF